MGKRFLTFLLLAVFTAGLTSCGEKKTEVTNEIELLEPMNAKLETTYVTKSEISQVELHNGAVIPSVEEFSFKENGYLYGVFVSPGQQVYKGDVLAGIVGPNHDAILSLEDDIKDIEDSREKTFEGYDMELKIAKLNGGDTSEKELDIKQKKELFEFELEQKKKRLENLKNNDIGYIYITAPYDATVAAVSALGANSYISKGTAVVALEDGGDPMITCDYISEVNYNKGYSCYADVRGQRLELEYIPYTKNELKVVVNNGSTPVSRFRIKNLEDKLLYVGDYAAVIEVKSYKGDVLVIPQNAVYSDSTGSFVYEIKDGERIRRHVILGLKDNANVEIVEGIEEGACVYVKS